MREIISTIGSGGRVTLPTEVRAALGVSPGAKIAFVIDEGEVRIKAFVYTLESVMGSVPALGRPTSEDFDIEIEEAIEEAMAEKMKRWGLP